MVSQFLSICSFPLHTRPEIRELSAAILPTERLASVPLSFPNLPEPEFKFALLTMATNSNFQNQQASTNYKEAFSLFDKRGTGRVALESLGDLLRACGQNRTLTDIRDLEKGVGGDCE